MERYEGIEKVKEVLEDMTDSELVAVYNEFADKNHYEHLYDTDEDTINSFFSGKSAYEVVKIAYENDLDLDNPYIMACDNGDYLTCEDPTDAFELSDLASYIYDNADWLDCDELDEVLTEIAEEDEDYDYL
jgi:hypothetical protein